MKSDDGFASVSWLNLNVVYDSARMKLESRSMVQFAVSGGCVSDRIAFERFF